MGVAQVCNYVPRSGTKKLPVAIYPAYVTEKVQQLENAPRRLSLSTNSFARRRRLLFPSDLPIYHSFLISKMLARLVSKSLRPSVNVGAQRAISVQVNLNQPREPSV